MVSLLLGLAWSLFIIAIAWLRFRPLVGLGMIGVALAFVVLLYLKGSFSKGKTVASPPPTSA